VLAAKDVHKTYFLGKVQVYALRGVTLTVPERSFAVIEGPSGSGKSTLLHILSCLDRPTAGDVEFRGASLGQLDRAGRARLRGKTFGFVFQKFNLIGNLSAQENVELPMALQGAPVLDRRTRALKALERVGLMDRARHRPGEMSGGEQQRVAIARALVNDPEVIFADEPTGNLDTKTGRQILDLLRGLNAEGKTLVVVTHNPEIAALASVCIVLQDGKVVKERSREVTSDEQSCPARVA